MTTTKLFAYQNGNTNVTLYSDGSRTIEYSGEKIQPEFPFNIDVRLSTKCAFGYNPKTNSAFCSYCHESARTDGIECDYEELYEVLSPLFGIGVELAVGVNHFSPSTLSFLEKVGKEFVVNLTINQGHLNANLRHILSLIDRQLVYGIGISYRESLEWKVPKEILDYPHTVFHVIAGIDNVQKVMTLKDKGVKKLLVLGEKDFGFNLGNVDLKSDSHIEWFVELENLIDTFDVLCFDNLAVEQLNVKRLLTKEKFQEMYQHEFSMYIDAPNKLFKRSSRTNEGSADYKSLSIIDYFKSTL